MDATWQLLSRQPENVASGPVGARDMNEYIRMRVRTDTAHCVALARNESKLAHPGMRGRFRELLIDNLLAPWLPPAVQIGTGVVIDTEGHCSAQQDIVLYDRALMPSVLASGRAPDGVFPVNAVLACVEVKSRLTRDEVRKSVEAAAVFEVMKFAAPEGSWPRPVSLIFAYDTDLEANSAGEEEMRRLIEVAKEVNLYQSDKKPPTPVIGLCVVNRGCWVFASAKGLEAQWCQARRSSAAEYEEVLLFVGALSNTCFSIHAQREGRDPKKGIDAGIGWYLLAPGLYDFVKF